MLGAGDSAMNGRDKIGAFTKLPCLAGETERGLQQLAFSIQHVVSAQPVKTALVAALVMIITVT